MESKTQRQLLEEADANKKEFLRLAYIIEITNFNTTYQAQIAVGLAIAVGKRAQRLQGEAKQAEENYNATLIW
ncbi:MAG: hypothetical protein UR39_C0002G0026 [Candidatus Woesebacteria bacterium GW2011_GWA1_33_30]|uniref:Uncharacterized protein n=1 Tax=Candidatus Woesebacteria bacterium GW2011_GWA2_33_28 TaxID=1618561 RepID=A0A0F9ZU93_9BACT|nr:MAG: hypothetical protein UR38_C0002G0026 [Candidatus Woesebacteria bacterium GW2011_GWA2_33_28]KKP48736.1 MAG: hypothetical protein UR39_C0002G0026 [Candidatus Woesebacteria bacterium GW2011_GWA1_33_30]KKP50009.1 MAG: hypothetical protein UR40_C0002G0026 [Microgenomates group bacterium GW2011_GWC1_33_32]KKP51780.1 MAG: hypothetical protein UR44_C0006G0026 [Candidatus Woesebacteria bacterium GW2011_GWB1_33_38]KKP58606.1 MAG: hypothetical protein UR48_C0003G0033 [Microgenomates group bacteriu